MPDDPIDPLPGMIAEIDQALEMVPQLARWARAMFEAFQKEGFTDDQALKLTAWNMKAPI